MEDLSLFDGRVQRLVLRRYEGRPPADAPPVKRLDLPQGELAQFHDSDEPVHYAAFLELLEGGVRGNHYHDRKDERVYVISGELELVVEDVGSGQRETLAMPAGSLARIRPGIAHAFRTVRPGQAVEFAQTRFNATDVHLHKLI